MMTTRCVRWVVILLGVLAFDPAVFAQTAEQPADTTATRVLACTSCHGVNGRGTDNDYFPRLAGKPAGYLYNQLTAFRSGQRRYAPMNYLLEFLPDSYLHEIAAYFAEQTPPLPALATPSVSGDLLGLGRKIALTGDPGSGVPACIGCHGARLIGMQPGIPGLLGLPPDYVSAQLGAWRYGTRTALAPDCMQIVAANLSEAEVTAVSAWLATLPAPPDTTPMAKGNDSLPLPCGSEPQ